MSDDEYRKLQEFLRRVKIVPADEYFNAITGDAPQPLICMPGLGVEFPDNMHGKCAVCDRVIHFRPYNEQAKFKICVWCAEKVLGKQEAS